VKWGAQGLQLTGFDVNPEQIESNMFGAAQDLIESKGRTPFKGFQRAGAGVAMGAMKSVGDGTMGTGKLLLHLATALPSEVSVLSMRLTGQNLNEVPFGGYATSVHEANVSAGSSVWNAISNPVDTYFDTGTAISNWGYAGYLSAYDSATSTDPGRQFSSGIEVGDKTTTLATMLYGGSGAVKNLSSMSRVSAANRASANLAAERSFYASLDGDANVGVVPRGVGNAGSVVYGPHLPKLSTYSERIATTPVSGGRWTGQRGESSFIFDDPEIQTILPDGIRYKDAYADFTPVALHQVELPGVITMKRGQNFGVADKMLAERLGITKRHIELFREEQRYTWHEVEDMRTMQLVPSFLHTGKQQLPMDFGVKYGHFGGIGERTRLWEQYGW
jgi:A nuclease of the HNH/ENDO VII superfamily with conserved WHH